MGRAAGAKKRRRQKPPRIQRANKLKRKRLTLPKIDCPIVNKAWDERKTIKANLQSMGLSVDPNATLDFKNKSEDEPMLEKGKTYVSTALEEEARKPKVPKLRLPKNVVKFCVYMLEKYGEDYDAMSKDPINYYQKTPGQIRKEINKFKKVPAQWNAYQRAKEEETDMDTSK